MSPGEHRTVVVAAQTVFSPAMKEEEGQSVSKSSQMTMMKEAVGINDDLTHIQTKFHLVGLDEDSGAITNH